MTAALAGLVDARLLMATGWMLLVVFWVTSLVGVLLAAWRTVRPRATAHEQHTAAVAAFSLALILAAAAPLALAVTQSAPAVVAPASRASSEGRSRAAAAFAPPSTFVAGEQRARGLSPDSIAGVAALVWILGVSVLTLRLLGGWIRAVAIKRRATPVADDRARDMAGRLHGALGLRCSVALLRSHEVEAPAVIGWRSPALILPTDLTDRLSSEMVGPLLAHEFAHIRRRDYLTNLLQSIVEILLFFSPAVTWMSRRIREAREYCCDDEAVVSCGDPARYVQALTTLASLHTINTARPVMGAAGPRLITRVRRLLASDAGPRFARLRLAAFAILLLALSVTGVRVTQASASRASLLAASLTAAPVQDRIPYGFATEQEGSGVDMHVLSSTWEAPVGSATIRNMTIEPVASVRFVAVIERFSTARGREPVRLFVSELLPVTIAPGATAKVSPNVLTEAELRQVVSDSGDARVQLFVGLTEVRYANGWVWQITPNPSALTPRDALSLPRSELPREVIVRDATAAGVSPSYCVDHLDRKSSLGAVVPVRDEPGRLARCVNGRWVDANMFGR